jgi:hypothetical protein
MVGRSLRMLPPHWSNDPFSISKVVYSGNLHSGRVCDGGPGVTESQPFLPLKEPEDLQPKEPVNEPQEGTDDDVDGLNASDNVNMVAYLQGDSLSDQTALERNRVKARATRFFWHVGQLWRRATTKHGSRPMLAPARRLEEVKRVHELAHFGRERTADAVSQLNWFRGVHSLAGRVVRTCHECTHNNVRWVKPLEIHPYPLDGPCMRIVAN